MPSSLHGFILLVLVVLLIFATASSAAPTDGMDDVNYSPEDVAEQLNAVATEGYTYFHPLLEPIVDSLTGRILGHRRRWTQVPLANLDQPTEPMQEPLPPHLTAAQRGQEVQPPYRYPSPATASHGPYAYPAPQIWPSAAQYPYDIPQAHGSYGAEAEYHNDQQTTTAGPSRPQQTHHAATRPQAYYDGAHRQQYRSQPDVPGPSQFPSFNLPHHPLQDWVTNTYVPGDRTGPADASQVVNFEQNYQDNNQHYSSSAAGPSTNSGQELPFPCLHPSCTRSYDNASDLSHHRRYHIPTGDRPHQCPNCDQRFLHPREVVRHQTVHNQGHGPRFYCPHETCTFARRGFGRNDNLIRHLNTVHAGIMPAETEEGAE